MVYGVWCMVYGVWCIGVWWFPSAVMIRPSQPSLARVGAGAELGKKHFVTFYIVTIRLMMGGGTIN